MNFWGTTDSPALGPGSVWFVHLAAVDGAVDKVEQRRQASAARYNCDSAAWRSGRERGSFGRGEVRLADR
jgi:hypothetical protein